jgi:transcription initiation factor TFIIE subunit alpha
VPPHLSVLDEELIKVANLLGGEEGVKVVSVLMNLKEATDELIAKDSAVRLNIIRKILFKLYDHGLVSCTRMRDERTGWYIFYWKLQTDQLDAFIRSRKRRTLERLKARLEYERNNTFFICKNDADVRITFGEAMESAFRCSKCGGQLENSDNSDLVKFLEKRIEQIENELKE